ncbi:D-alanyl-D-alanine carboxypeptidase family protein [Feifania hominis]|uniref:serine-type D-Ala-D-Ala carboxypeptidase n=1 Tax=Feifania hominis TaxID=2763660 RepID=A0A926HVN0_9FIRM|nr:D-alanyl-D-alanine carboxypeptidase family protein [Feifania hominis]MBC8536796.1 D-alanyl-D-alanine carboxypeptidase [Feifania hominis]
MDVSTHGTLRTPEEGVPKTGRRGCEHPWTQPDFRPQGEAETAGIGHAGRAAAGGHSIRRCGRGKGGLQMRGKREICVLLAAALLLFAGMPAAATLDSELIETIDVVDEAEIYEQGEPTGAVDVTPLFEVTSPSAILMEQSTGRVLYEKNPDEPLPPASVTKVMSLLLVMEALDSGAISLEDPVTCSEVAAGMGGSQIYLEPGEVMTVDELLKAAVVASANDATAALAEHVAGSVDTFVAKMNARAAELGMTNTVFKNTTGLPTEGHLTTARDIAIMSRELMKHEKIKDYTLIWMDTVRNGEFGLANTNKLVKTYQGITGLKTGSTSEAKFCLSATAERDGMGLVAVVLAAPSGKERFADATKILDYGFATYEKRVYEAGAIDPMKVLRGTQPSVALAVKNPQVEVVVPKGSNQKISTKVEVCEDLQAPVDKGQKVGQISFYLDGELLATSDVVCQNDVPALTFAALVLKGISQLFGICEPV